MKKKILFITPPYHCGVLESAGRWLPLNFVYLAGSLQKAGYEVAIYDAMVKFHNYPEIRNYLENSPADVVATTAYTAMINDALQALKLAKEVNPSVITLLGGIHPTFCFEEILQENHSFVDYIIRGEGEETIIELVNCLSAGDDPVKVSGIAFRQEGKIVSTAERSFVADFDSLPMAWDLIDWRDYTFRTKPGSILAMVSSSRGCTQGCTFCSQRLFWKQSWRARKPENFVIELEYLNKKYGIDVVMLSDEVPTLDRARWERILDLLIAKKMDMELLMETRVDDILRDKDILHKYKKAGVLHIYVGVESASQETLDRFHKNLKIEQSAEAIELINQQEIISETSFVLGMPEDTPESIKKTIELAQYYNPDMAFFLAIAPWPYSEIYPELKPYIQVFDYSKYNLVNPVVKPKQMTLEELNRALLNAFRTFYIRKFSQLEQISKFKKDYLLAVAKLFVEHSYLAQEMKSISGKIPEEVQKLITQMSADKVDKVTEP
ncbi:MAG TPA: magnesium-protoporphyrin IX monomethyl ester oxidative cyclase [Elusimicrobia bacterium]|nr:magnesium-protoporphyrin IX monomethyl ester oxidative cyclase [Elusimicrobiota bacterium]